MSIISHCKSYIDHVPKQPCPSHISRGYCKTEFILMTINVISSSNPLGT